MVCNTTESRKISEIRYAIETYKSLALQLTDYLVNEKSLPFLIKCLTTKLFFSLLSIGCYSYCNRPTDVYNARKVDYQTLDEMLKIRTGVKESTVKSDWVKICKRFDVINADSTFYEELHSDANHIK